MKPFGKKYCWPPGWSIGVSGDGCCDWSCATAVDAKANGIRLAIAKVRLFIVVPTQERQIFSGCRGDSPIPCASPAGRDALSFVCDGHPTRPNRGDRRDSGKLQEIGHDAGEGPIGEGDMRRMRRGTRPRIVMSMPGLVLAMPFGQQAAGEAEAARSGTPARPRRRCAPTPCSAQGTLRDDRRRPAWSRPARCRDPA